MAVGCTKYGGRIGNYPETQGWIPVVNARDETCNSYGGGKALECARPPPPPLQCACGCGRHRLAHPAGTSRRLREGEFRRGATPGAPLLPPRLIPIHASPDHAPRRRRASGCVHVYGTVPFRICHAGCLYAALGSSMKVPRASRRCAISESRMPVRIKQPVDGYGSLKASCRRTRRVLAGMRALAHSGWRRENARCGRGGVHQAYAVNNHAVLAASAGT